MKTNSYAIFSIFFILIIFIIFFVCRINSKKSLDTKNINIFPNANQKMSKMIEGFRARNLEMSSSIWDFELKKVKFPENTGKGWLYRTCRGDRVCITDAKKVGGLNVCGNVADGSPGAVYECKNNNFAGLDTPHPKGSLEAIEWCNCKIRSHYPECRGNSNRPPLVGPLDNTHPCQYNYDASYPGTFLPPHCKWTTASKCANDNTFIGGIKKVNCEVSGWGVSKPAKLLFLHS